MAVARDTRWKVPAWMRTFVRGAADFLYPPVCRMCAAELPEPGAGLTSAEAMSVVPFCELCRRDLLISRGLACIRCGGSIGPFLDPKVPCSFCRDERYAFERVIRLGVYDEALRTACLRAKNSGAEPLTAGLAELLWECETDTFRDCKIDVVVPVPHHWLRRFYRSHNAANTLGSVWASRLQVPLASHILVKSRWTRPQARLTPHERRQNLRNVFQAIPSQGLAGAVVLLADDVMTTGTTAHESAKVLLQAGAARVIVAVVARGLGRR
jgi:competence protein ComFC